MLRLFEQAVAVGCHVLINGQRTGKEIFAQAIHNASSNSQFVAINGSVTGTVAGVRITGYARGAYRRSEQS